MDYIWVLYKKNDFIMGWVNHENGLYMSFI